MAFRGSASTVNASSGNTCAITVSGIGIALNDIILFFASGGGNDTFTYPSGFTAVPGLSNIRVNAAGDGELGVAYKVATSTEVSATTLTVSTNQSPGWMGGHIRVYSGRNTSTPFSAVSSTANTAASGNPLNFTLTGLTASAGDDIVQIVAVSFGTEATSYTTPPSGFANSAILDNGGNFQANLAAADKVNSSGGATGNLTGAVATFGGSYAYGGYVLSLAAPSASGVSAYYFRS